VKHEDAFPLGEQQWLAAAGDHPLPCRFAQRIRVVAWRPSDRVHGGSRLNSSDPAEAGC